MGRTNQMQQRNTIGSGNGVLLVGPAGGVNVDTFPSGTHLQEVGSLEGDSQVSFQRDMLEILDGQPQVLIKKEVVRESARITCVLKEKRLAQVCQQLGFTAAKATALEATSVVITGEKKQLHSTSWAHLMGRNVQADPAPTVSTTGEATPTVYTVNVDYVLDLTNGLIRRTTASNIPDGATVTVGYTWQRPYSRILKFGGDTSVAELSLVFIYKQPEDNNRVITIFPRCMPSEGMQEDYRTGNVNTRNLSFDAVYEPTATAGEGLAWQVHEGETQSNYYTA